MLIALYNKIKVWYNFTVKRLAALTTSLLLTVTAFGGFSAYAETGATVYPDDEAFTRTLTFSNLSDYEIDGGCYYFADGETVCACKDGELSYPDEEIEFSADEDTIPLDGYLYYFDADGKLTVFDKTSKQVNTFEGEYSKLKCYGQDVYAVKDNELYLFAGSKEQKIVLEYTDYSQTENIIVGKTAEALKNYPALTFVNVAEGAHMTEVDLTHLDGYYFNYGKEGSAITAESGTVALLLCYTGNAAIIAKEDVSYILKASNITPVDENFTATFVREAEFSSATLTGSTVYASPYVIIGTSLLSGAAGTIVSVKHKIECEGVLGSAFYEVEYETADKTVKTGYVADGFLTEYIIEDNKQPQTFPDPDYSEESDVQTVLLILAVVILVLAALAYMLYISTSGKRKDKKSKKSKKDKVEPAEPEQQS